MNRTISLARHSGHAEFRRRSLRALPLLATCALALAACNRQAAPVAMPPPEVATITVAQQPLVLTTELPGRVSAFRVAEIRPQVNGLIKRRLYTEGAAVAAGEVLYQIEPSPLQAVYDSALAALARAEANLPAARALAERYEGLAVDKAVSAQTLENALAARRQAEADVLYYKAAAETARINLGYTQITSPIAGRTGPSSVTDGAIVTAYQGSPLTSVQQLDPIYVDVPQSTSEILRLERRLADGRLAADKTARTSVQLIEEDGTPYRQNGTLEFRDVTVDQTTGAVTLRMVFPNSDGILLPGMFVRAVVNEGVKPDAILIPQQSVLRDPRGNPYVLLVDPNNVVQRQAVTIDRAIANQWFVTDGLKAGDRLMVEGFQRSRPGITVKPVAAASTTTASAVQPAR
ncbi:MAG: efflux RND transporter periplasmic adaptor subunit [Opitutaceae bacterium]